MTEVTVWSGPVGGLAIGLFLVAMAWISGKPLGCSTAYGNLCALGSRRAYFRSGPYRQPNNWRLWFLLGIPLGGLLAGITSSDPWTMSLAMGLYDQVLPQAVWAKGLFLVGSGVLIGYGARVAGGCQSGHSITGLALLNLPSLVASMGFFVGGIIAVQSLFRLLGGA